MLTFGYLCFTFSTISDIILDYVTSPIEGEYTTPNTKKRIRSSTSTPGSTDKQQSQISKRSRFGEPRLSGAKIDTGNFVIMN
jgi:hypothetical protein